VGAPKVTTKIHPGDQLILYGRSDSLRELDTRHAGASGEAAHDRAVRKQESRSAEPNAEEEPPSGSGRPDA
jgi:hypothetical protein